jgi:hypothetical protein
MEPAYQQQIRTPKGSTNQGILIGRPLQGRSKQLGGCPFPRVENPWLFKVSPFGALAIRAGIPRPAGPLLANRQPSATVSSKKMWDMLRAEPGNEMGN